MSLTTTDKQDIKVMIRDGIAHLPTKAYVHDEISRLESKFDGLENKFDGLESKFDGLDGRVNKVEVLLEDTNVTVKQMLGMLSDNLKIKPQVDNHEVRLANVEAIQPSIISTLALHSKQLKI